jgi:hypothetical protein
MLLLVILGYYKLFHPRLFLAILSNFNIWLLVFFIGVMRSNFSSLYSQFYEVIIFESTNVTGEGKKQVYI